MGTFIAAFVVLLLFFLLMSIGYIVKRTAVAGSCGGLGTLGIDKACDCDDPCESRKTKILAEEARREKLADKRII